MKNPGKIISILLIGTLCLSIFSSNAKSTTTIGNTTFPADEGDSYLWKVSSATGPAELFFGWRINLTIEDIDHGLYLDTNSLIVNCTIDCYNKTGGVWYNDITRKFYMAANISENFIKFGSWLSSGLIIFIIPIPINLNLIGEYLDTLVSITGSSVSGNTIISSGGVGIYEQTFNSNGILTKFVTKVEGEIMWKLTLETPSDDNGIPLGYSFVIFMIISILAIIYIEERKIKNLKN
ncbi:MAG: hypothetical protein ACFFFT_06760 [Candidatus Thorarchaeota archaeon]